MSTKNPKYDFSSPILRKDLQLLRLAKEHELISQLDLSDVKVEVKGTISSLNIPNAYDVHYNLESIIGIDQNSMPIFGDLHIVEISLPVRYPLESPRLKMITDVWHPNIKSSGKFKGRICANTKNFGKGYNLDLLIIRIKEILLYRNYHALNTSPFPEDEQVAAWVREFAEPHGIIVKDLGLAVHISKEKTTLQQKTEERPNTNRRIVLRTRKKDIKLDRENSPDKPIRIRINKKK